MNGSTLWLSCLAAGLCLTGCGAGPLPYLKEHPPAELTCPSEQWEVERVGQTGLIYITGCDEIVRYVAHCNPNGLCVDEEHVVVSRVLRRQATFDLQCEERISLTRLGDDTFGAKGCGRQASYKLLRCTSDGCTVVQNTQSQ